MKRRVWFARARAATWVILGIVSFPLGWANSVVLVWIASVYANVESGIAAGEAADDSAVLAELAHLRQAVARIESRLCPEH